jgi:hypothetical protein
LTCISARKAIWKAPATTLPNTLLVNYLATGLDWKYRGQSGLMVPWRCGPEPSTLELSAWTRIPPMVVKTQKTCRIGVKTRKPAKSGWLGQTRIKTNWLVKNVTFHELTKTFTFTVSLHQMANAELQTTRNAKLQMFLWLSTTAPQHQSLSKSPSPTLPISLTPFPFSLSPAI